MNGKKTHTHIHIRGGLMLGPQNAHGRTFVKMQNLAGAGAE